MRRSRGRASAALWRSALAVVLGLSRRPPRSDRRPPAASSFEAPAAAADALQFGRAYWLPPFGVGNGLEALFWAPLARLPEARIGDVLGALAEQDIAAWAAEARDRSGRAPSGDRPCDLWVASAELDTAQDVLMRVLAA